MGDQEMQNPTVPIRSKTSGERDILRASSNPHPFTETFSGTKESLSPSKATTASHILYSSLVWVIKPQKLFR